MPCVGLEPFTTSNRSRLFRDFDDFVVSIYLPAIFLALERASVCPRLGSATGSPLYRFQETSSPLTIAVQLTDLLPLQFAYLHSLSISHLLLPRSNFIISLLIYRWSMQLRGDLVVEHKDIRIVVEESIDIFQTPVRGLGIEEVGDRNEAEAYDGPDDPELVAQVGDTKRC